MWYWSLGTNFNCWVGILLHASLEAVVEKVISDPEGRFIVLDVTKGNCKLSHIYIYAPNGEKVRKEFIT